MKNCLQTSGMNILEHGLLVQDRMEDITSFLKGNELQKEWRLPSWVIDYKQGILERLLPEDILKDYAINHDCGKPFCREVDSEGKQHFPNHAPKSSEIWLEISKAEDCTISERNKQIANLILHDMDIHTIKAESIGEFAKMPEAISLMITGLAEIHANAGMFGGLESTSFKIKWKQLDKRGKAICKEIFAI